MHIYLKVRNKDEEKIECALGNMELCFWQGKKAEYVVFNAGVGIRGPYLSLTLGTGNAKFKQLETGYFTNTHSYLCT